MIEKKTRAVRHEVFVGLRFSGLRGQPPIWLSGPYGTLVTADERNVNIGERRTRGTPRFFRSYNFSVLFSLYRIVSRMLGINNTQQRHQHQQTYCASRVSVAHRGAGGTGVWYQRNEWLNVMENILLKNAHHIAHQRSRALRYQKHKKVVMKKREIMTKKNNMASMAGNNISKNNICAHCVRARCARRTLCACAGDRVCAHRAAASNKMAANNVAAAAKAIISGENESIKSENNQQHERKASAAA